MERLGRLALVAVVGLAATSGCGARSGSAFDLGDGRMQNCVSMAGYDTDDRAVFGELLLKHQGDRPMTIATVSLVDAHELALAGAFLVDVGPEAPGAAIVGVGRTSNLDSSGDRSAPAGWDSRRDAEGTTVQPGEVWNLVMVVDSHSDGTAWARATRIVYSDGRGRKYHQETLSTIVVTQQDCQAAMSEVPDFD